MCSMGVVVKVITDRAVIMFNFLSSEAFFLHQGTNLPGCMIGYSYFLDSTLYDSIHGTSGDRLKKKTLVKQDSST